MIDPYKEILKSLTKTTYNGFEYYIWFEDEDCRVAFSQIPDIKNKLINKNVMGKEEVKKAKAKPLYLNNTVSVVLTNKNKNAVYHFVIHAGYDYDGASICRAFWRIVGSKEDISFKIASLIHDVLCENHHYVDSDRYFADRTFEKLLSVSGVCPFLRWLMFHSVDNFQKFCHW